MPISLRPINIWPGLLPACCLLLAACSSSEPPRDMPASTDNYTQPDLTGVGGVTPRFEPPSRIGNKDYVVNGQSYKVWNGINHYNEEGTASWYGPGFHGFYTSNGEIYDQESISAAHKNLPLPSYLKVTNLDNGRKILVRVNDRGPFHGNRILDLSHGAASQLGIVGPGTARVRVELVKVTPPLNAPQIIAQHEARTIQLMVTGSVSKANQMAQTVSHQLGKPCRVVAANQVYKLHIGPLDKSDAEQTLAQLRRNGYPKAFFLP